MTGNKARTRESETERERFGERERGRATQMARVDFDRWSKSTPPNSQHLRIS